MATQLHIDCFSGISGDMMLGALVDLGLSEDLLGERLASLDLPGNLAIRRIAKAGFAAVKVDVDAPHERVHRHLKDVLKIIDGSSLNDPERMIAEKMFRRLAEAEARSHGISIEKVHFHEVGAVDSIYDFVGVAVGLAWLNADLITSRPVPTGSGWVDCEHGRLPVPAPAVAHLLTGVPLATSAASGELTTPTGAAIIATNVNSFSDQVDLTIEKVGIGAGTRDVAEHPNVLRLFHGTAVEEGAANDAVWQLETNLDDVSPEVVGYCFDRLFEAGALDVYTIPLQMKKNRPGVMVCVLCRDDIASAIERVLFTETSTLGIRKRRVLRSTAARSSITVQTPWGPVQGKLNQSNQTAAPEYEDCARIARDHQLPLVTVYREVDRLLRESLADRPETESLP